MIIRSVITMAIALLVGGCASGAPECQRISYNRREIPPGPGVFSGPSGTYTIYRRGDDDDGTRQECHPSAHGRGGVQASERRAD